MFLDGLAITLSILYVSGMAPAKTGKSPRRSANRPRLSKQPSLSVIFGVPILMMVLFSLIPGVVVMLRLCIVSCDPVNLYWIGYLGLGVDIIALVWYAICLFKLPLDKGQRLIAATGGILALVIFAVVLRLGVW